MSQAISLVALLVADHAAAMPCCLAHLNSGQDGIEQGAEASNKSP